MRVPLGDAHMQYEHHNIVCQMYSIPDVCRLLGIGRSSVYRLIRERKIHAIKIRSRTLIASTAIAFLIENTAGESAK